MGRKRKKFELRRNANVGWEILESDAFRTLSKTGIRVLLRFIQKRTWTKVGKKVIYDERGLVFTYAEARAMKISDSQFYTSITKLVELGFIDIEHQGGGVGRDYSRYALSDRWKDYGAPFFEKVSKPRRLWPGKDVRSRMERLKITAENQYP